MAFDAREASKYGGQPEEFYVFSVLGGKTYRYTPMRLPLTYQGFEFSPKVIERSDYTFKKDLTSEDTMKIDVQSDLDILDLFKIIVPRRTMDVVIYRRHRGDPDSEVWPVFIGRVRGCSWSGAKATIECDSMNAMAKRGGLTLNFQVPCNHFLYNSGCKLNKGDWGVFGTVASIDGVKVTSGAFGTKPDGWFKYGFLEIGNGSYMIATHVGETVTLLQGLEGATPGQTFNAYAGCNRTLDQCWDKFNNGLNHLGFTWSPADNVFATGL